MSVNRLSQLKALLEEQPGDPFILYAIALEVLPKQPAEAGALFEELLKNHPEYLPTYYMAAEYYAERGQNAQAEQVYQRGIALADKQNNAKAGAELRNAYQNWQLEL